MRLHWIELQNYCQYEKARFEFDLGITAIVGPNKAGKSNLMNAVAALLTNNYGKAKAKCLRRGIPARAKARIAGEWTIDEQTFTIDKDLKGSDTFMQIGDERITGATAAQAKIREITKLSEEVLSNNIFPAQGSLFSLVAESRADRIDGFMHLCGISQATKIYDAIQKEIRSYYNNLPEIDETALDALHRRYRSIELSRDELKKKIEETEKRCMAKAVLLKHEEGLGLIRRLAELNQRHDTCAETVAAAKLQLTNLRSKLLPCAASSDALTERIDAVNADIEIWRARKTLIDKIKTELPPEPEDQDALQAETAKLEQQRAELRSTIDRLGRVNAMVTAGASECTTCGSPICAAPGEAEALAAELSNCVQKRSEVMAKLAELAKRSAAAVEAAVAFSTAQRAREEASRALEATVKPEKQASVLRDELLALTQERAAIRKLEKEQRTLAESVAAASGRLESAEQALADVEDQRQRADQKLAALKHELGVQSFAQTLVTSAREAAAAAQVLRTSLDDKESELLELKQEIDAAASVASANKPARKIRQRLLAIQEQCRPDALPKQVILAELANLEVHTNKFLRRLGESFDIKLDDRLAFKAIYPGGDTEDAAEFSFAQKAVTAVSFLMASNRVFAGVCDFMTLDEPSSGFDEEHLADFADMLGELDDFLRAEERQMLIVTHDNRVLESIKQVIRITRND